MSLFILKLYGSYYYCSVVQLEIRDGVASRSAFTLQDYLALLGFAFPYEVDYCSSSSVNNCDGILIVIASKM